MVRDCEARRQEITSFLGRTEFFGDLTEAQLEGIAEICSQRTFARGALIFDEDSESSEIFVVREGKVSIGFGCDEQGCAVNLYALGEGQLFGWSGLWDDVERTGRAVATEETTCVVMTGPDLQRLFKRDYDVGYRLMRSLTGVIAGRLAVLKMHYLDLDVTE